MTDCLQHFKRKIHIFAFANHQLKSQPLLLENEHILKVQHFASFTSYLISAHSCRRYASLIHTKCIHSKNIQLVRTFLPMQNGHSPLGPSSLQQIFQQFFPFRAAGQCRQQERWRRQRMLGEGLSEWHTCASFSTLIPPTITQLECRTFVQRAWKAFSQESYPKQWTILGKK